MHEWWLLPTSVGKTLYKEGKHFYLTLRLVNTLQKMYS